MPKAAHESSCFIVNAVTRSENMQNPPLENFNYCFLLNFLANNAQLVSNETSNSRLSADQYQKFDSYPKKKHHPAEAGDWL